MTHHMHLGTCECRMAAAVAEKQLKQTPHGGKLVDLTLRQEDWEQAIDSCTMSTELSDRGACDVELLANGYASMTMTKLRLTLILEADSTLLSFSFKCYSH